MVGLQNVEFRSLVQRISEVGLDVVHTDQDGDPEANRKTRRESVLDLPLPTLLFLLKTQKVDCDSLILRRNDLQNLLQHSSAHTRILRSHLGQLLQTPLPPDTLLLPLQHLCIRSESPLELDILQDFGSSDTGCDVGMEDVRCGGERDLGEEGGVGGVGGGEVSEDGGGEGGLVESLGGGGVMVRVEIFGVTHGW